MTEQATVAVPDLNALLALANEAAEQSDIDMSETSSGGGGKLYPVGYAFARLVEYIDFGSHASEFNGQAKPPAPTFRLGFAIWGKPPNQEETYHNEDGTPGIIRTYDMRLSNNEKAGAKIAFDKMNYTGKFKQFFQMLSQPFLLKIEHTKPKDASKPVRAKINLKETLPPFDPATGNPYQIAEVDPKLFKLFLWNKPTKEGWDSLFIEGQNDKGESKNWIQETIQKAADFQGSPLHLLLGGAALPTPEQLASQPAPAVPGVPTAPVTAPAVPEVPAQVPAAPAAPETPAAPSIPVSEVPFVPDAPQAPAAPAAPAAPVPPTPPVVQ